MDTKKAALIGLGMLAAAVPFVGYTLSLPFRIRHEKARFAGLPGHLRGLKILHIADFHGRYSDKMHRDIWPALLALDFDMAVFTGDVILDDVSQLYPHSDGLRALVEKAPVFYVDGNHDEIHLDRVTGFFERLGIIGLHNRRGDFAVGANARARSAVLSIVGFRDYYYLKRHGYRAADTLIDDIDKGGFHLVLTHQPQIFDRLPKDMCALVLAGHTHGGQLRLPFFPTLYAPGQGAFPRYGEGWYGSDNLKLFISSGVGATHFRLRLFNPPEVAIIELGD